MGYETAFKGKFKVTPTLKPEHLKYLIKFQDTRRMRRDVKITEGRPDPLRQAVGLPLGPEGSFFVGAEGMAGQEDGDEPFAFKGMDHYTKVGILDYNSPPDGQPGLWCCWEPTEDGKGIWVPNENKHYHYIEWLNYLIDNFLTPWGYNLSGKVRWKGEGRGDRGFICVSNNVVYVNQEPTALDKIVEAVTTKKEKRRS